MLGLYLINETPPAFTSNELVMIKMEDDNFDKMIVEQLIH